MQLSGHEILSLVTCIKLVDNNIFVHHGKWSEFSSVTEPECHPQGRRKECPLSTITDARNLRKGIEQTRLFNNGKKLINPPSTQAFQCIDSWQDMVPPHWLGMIRTSDSNRQALSFLFSAWNVLTSYSLPRIKSWVWKNIFNGYILL